MDLLSELKRDRRFWGTCPSCAQDFALRHANLFSADNSFPEEAQAKIAERRLILKAMRKELGDRKRRITEGAKITAESVNLGKILEKIIPSFGDFAFKPRDCRSLLEPIDYVIFSGLSQTAMVDSVIFLEVKSGKSRLTKQQRDIASAIERGSVQFSVIGAG